MSRGRPVPPILSEAFARQKELRREFGELRDMMFNDAEEATKGVMLNRLGMERDIDPYHLFTGNRSFAYCYASEELVEWWETHPRMTMNDYERQMFEPEPTVEPAEWSQPYEEWDDTPF